MKRIDILVSDLCAEIDGLRYKCDAYKEERNMWRLKYMEFLDNNINHSNAMMGNILDVLLIPGVTDAVIENNKDATA